MRFTIAYLPLPFSGDTMKSIASLICFCLICAAAPAWAGVDRDGASAMAQKATGGRVLAVDKTERDGRTVWRVKVLTPQGEVRLLQVDAASGRLQ